MTDRNRLNLPSPRRRGGDRNELLRSTAYGDKGAERLIVVDTGVAFPRHGRPAGRRPDPARYRLAGRAPADRIEGIFITHAHEDHVGGLGHLWSRLRAPVYARAFTAIHARRKMEEVGQDPEQVRVVEAYPASGRGRPLPRAVRAGQPLDPRGGGAGDRTRPGAASSTPATSRSTAIRWSARPSTRRCSATSRAAA